MLLLFGLLLFVPNAVAECPSGSVLWSPLSMCYFFVTTPETFSEAERSCNNLNGNLASIHESFTNAFINTQAKSLFSGNINISIGLSCKSGNCLWTDGSLFDYNDFTNSSNLNGCGTMSISTGYWNIGNCSDSRFYVCERPENVVTSTSSPSITTPQAVTTSSESIPLCPSDDWIYYNETNSCYYWTDSSDWATAEAFCVNQSAHLASIHSPDELNFFKFIYNGYLWIGLHADGGFVNSNTQWLWTDGSYLDYLPWNSTYSPPNYGDGLECVQAGHGVIWNTNCSRQATGICKKPSSKIVASTKCLAGWTYNQKTDSCYFGPTSALTQKTAENYCASMGGHLPSVHSKDELQFLNYATSNRKFWIGLMTTDNPIQLNTTWQWIDKTPVNYISWFNGIPSLDDQLCAISVSANGYPSRVYGFQNANCSSFYMAMCKRLPLDAIPTPNPVSTTTFKPPNPCNNARIFGDYFIPAAQMNWTVAEEYCELCDGSLASFHNSEDLSNIVNNIYNDRPGDFWTGLYSQNNQRTWKWIDGSAFDFSSWLSGYPIQGIGSCATLRIGWGNTSPTYGMANNNCSTSSYGLCKFHTRLIYNF